MSDKEQSSDETKPDPKNTPLEPEEEVSSDDLIGSQIGQFSVLEEVGRGGMATVYRATQQSINRDVALKVLPRAFLHDPGFFERFEREVDVIAHLEHPHIVPIYDYGESKGMPYIAMRYLSGGSLRQLIRGATADLNDLIRPLSQVAQALDHAHQQGIIHRDLKPGNILLDASGNAYLSDFGIARVLNSDLTGSAIIGTPAYMSPEQANGDPMDGRADVYALGIVVFQMITGHEPFQAATPIAMLLKQINERVPSLTEYRSNIPESVDRVIAKATEKKPDDRYSTAGELAAAFEDAVRGMSGNRKVERVAHTGSEDLTEPMDVSFDGENNTPAPIPSTDLESKTVTPETDNITHDDIQEKIASPIDGPRTEFATNMPSQLDQKPKRRWPLLITVGVVVAIAVAFGLSALTGGETSLADAVPLYEDDMSIIVRDRYALGIPAAFDAVDTEDSDLWQSDNGEASVEVALFEGEDNLAEFAVSYASETELEPIDATDIESGTLRQSYRTPGGQTDVFFGQVGDAVLVVELFAADGAGDTFVPTFQQILSSVRVLPS